MAYMSQEKKAKIAESLKKVVPAGWKYSLRVQHHSTIILTIQSAPVDLFGLHKGSERWKDGYIQLNEYHLDTQYDEPLLGIFTKIRAALNTDNHDRSDVMTDYFDVGHYVSIKIGNWDKPFLCTAKRELSYDEIKARIAELEAKC